MKRKIILIFIGLLSFGNAQKTAPVDYWNSLEEKAKIAFVNGVYASTVAIKSYHKRQVREQYLHHPGWIQPYYIERFYDILNEHVSTKIGYDLGLITAHMDALYSNYDNRNIPIVKAIRIVSVDQDGEREKANLLLLKAQRKYK